MAIRVCGCVWVGVGVGVGVGVCMCMCMCMCTRVRVCCFESPCLHSRVSVILPAIFLIVLPAVVPLSVCCMCMFNHAIVAVDGEDHDSHNFPDYNNPNIIANGTALHLNAVHMLHFVWVCVTMVWNALMLSHPKNWNGVN